MTQQQQKPRQLNQAMPSTDSPTLRERFVERLNEFLRLDPAAMNALVNARVPCNEALEADPRIMTTVFSGQRVVGALGLFNGFVEPPIEAVFENDTLVAFK